MKKNILLLAIVTIFTAVEGGANVESYLLLDDFRGERSAVDTEWKGFTDRVMGGVSDMSVSRIPGPEGNFLRMQGKVSIENNGGFIQVRLDLPGKFRPFDGSGYKGIRVKARGEGTGYYIFARTSNTIFPWKYYAAPLPVSEEWDMIDIPWSAFKPGDFGVQFKFHESKLKSLALVAYGKDFDAMIDLSEIGLYGG